MGESDEPSVEPLLAFDNMPLMTWERASFSLDRGGLMGHTGEQSESWILPLSPTSPVPSALHTHRHMAQSHQPR